MDLCTRKFFVCKHVRFDESIFPFDMQPPMQHSRHLDQGGEIKPWGAFSGYFRQTLVYSTAMQHTVIVAPGEPTSPPDPVLPTLSVSTVASSRSNSVSQALQYLPAVEPPATTDVIVPTVPHRTHLTILRHMTNGGSTGGSAFIAAAYLSEPTCYSQEVKYPEWRDAKDLEFNSLLHKKTWRLVPFEPNMNVIGCKWVFHTKRKSDGSVEGHKARLGYKGFN